MQQQYKNPETEKKLKKLSVENELLKKELLNLKQKLEVAANGAMSGDENCNFVYRLKTQNEILAFLTTHKAIGTGDLETAKKLICEATAKTLNVERCSIWLLSDDNLQLNCINLFENTSKKHSEGYVLNAENYPEYFKTLQRKAIVSAPDAWMHEATKEFAEGYLKPLGIVSMLDAVIFDERGIKGVLCLEHIGEIRQWTEDEENFSKILASLYIRTQAIKERIDSEFLLKQKNDEYEAQNEEYLQINEELRQSMDELSHTKEKLEYNQQQINTILGIVEEMVWSQDFGSSVPNYMSPSCTKVMGREAWEFYNDPNLWKKIIHPDDSEYVLKSIANLGNKKYLDLEYRIIHKDGSIHWINDRTNITLDEFNKPVRMDGIVSDITDRKIADEMRKIQENKIKTILKTMPDLLFIIDRNGYYQEVFANNPGDLLVSQEKVVGINAIDVFGEKEGKRHISAFRKCLSTKKLQVIEYSISEKNKNLYFEARLSPLDNNNVLAIVREITERIEFEARLAHERDLLHNLMDSIPDAIFFKDDQGKFTRINKPAAEIMGLDDPEKASGKTIFDFFPKPEAKKITDIEKKILKTGESFIGEIEYIASPTGFYWFISSKVPIRDINGKIVGTVGISKNITQLKEAQEMMKLSEELYRSIAENASDGIYLRNDKNFEYVNERFCEITGYSKEELMSNKFDFRRLLTKETADEVEVRSSMSHTDIKISNTYEGIIKCKNGEYKKVEFSVSKLKRNNKALLLGVMRDITERKRNEDLLREIEIARQSAIFKQNFLANMSHEIRTPLTGIIGMLEIIDKTELSVLQKNYFSVLKHSTENLREIINQVLDFSKIEAGKVALKVKAFEFKSLITQANTLFGNLCNKKIKFESSIDPNIPVFIKADENRVNQIMNNLISNAVKFTEKGKITVKASLVEYKELSRQVIIKIEVSDTGIGIKKENQKQLFKPFSQVDDLDVRQHEGTGLGLSISKELVALHGGEIGCISEYGKGSTFWFTFRAIATLQKMKTAKQEIKESKPSKVLHILYAEDKVINQKVVKLMLNHMGHEVFMVKNGQEAIKAYKPGKFDLIIMDIQMPVMDGITATTLLREKYKKLPPVVGLSANAFEGDREKYISLGLDEYLTKPITSDDFADLFKDLFQI